MPEDAGAKPAETNQTGGGGEKTGDTAMHTRFPLSSRGRVAMTLLSRERDGRAHGREAEVPLWRCHFTASRQLGPEVRRPGPALGLRSARALRPPRARLLRPIGPARAEGGADPRGERHGSRRRAVPAAHLPRDRRIQLPGRVSPPAAAQALPDGRRSHPCHPMSPAAPPETVLRPSGI